MATALIGDITFDQSEDPTSFVLRENEHLRSGLQRLKQDFEHNLGLLNDRDQRIEQLEARINDAAIVSSEIRIHQQESAQQKSKISALEAELTKVQDKLKSTSDELLQTKIILSDRDAKVAELVKQRDRFELEAVHAEKMNKTLEGRVKELIDREKRLEESARSANGKLEKADEARATEFQLRQVIGNLQNEIDDLHSDKKHAVESSHSLKRTLEGLQEDLWTIQRGRDKAEKKTAVAVSEAKGLRVMLANSQNQISLIRQKQTGLEIQVTDLEDQLSRAKNSAARYKRQRDDARARVGPVLAERDGGDRDSGRNMRRIDRVVRKLKEFDSEKYNAQ
ncbi:Chromosome partition protein Smc [Carpediemonas membranifera]|uniref:Chromosome partition protein Smc n=1 Tax=Carpediemonas membranifera TaxID=201153 RepID=A0A8J6AUA7_9EUKA|nr:Chromosome partition protein Smc [Carpediemonas membranifera]|eukprot:KAG9392660.1 Chromosome partition protein Smc [Carpediemonas membranifera]